MERGNTTPSKEKLQHVYWIGGGSGGGKTTIAQRIVDMYGLQLYSSDETMTDHARRSTPESCPYLHKFMAMDMDTRWLHRTPTEMFDTFHWFHGEGFDFVIDDLITLRQEPAVVSEGLRLLPHLVQPLLAQPHHAVWLIPTRRFREAVFNNRGGSRWGFIGKTSQPDLALHNLIERDTIFDEYLRKEVQRLGLNSIAIEPTMTVDEAVARVVGLLRL